MPRLTRLESQTRTREKLLATAKKCFLRDGYAATSLDSIAAAAGFSKGAVYSNFKSKDELCLAVLDSVRAEHAARLASAVAGRRELGEQIAAFEEWAEQHVGDRAWTSLEVEFGMHASRDAALGKALAHRDRALRTFLIKAVASLVTAHGIELSMSVEDVTTALLSLGIGLGVQRAIDPRLSVRSLGHVARLLSGPRATARAASARPSRTRRTKG